ncbi:AsmA family protein [Rhodoferax sp. BAB1]|uniref:AsmA family protein n=1 Tax=Rhodoferax sp. BAB1 TaxID=2741720 RepID=UPI0015766726|nr:AsmA family protein [Rhodoferax sp. BAB1]QKO23607.1 AsmA family protein [Rhodoferax sp. BAB1]
MSKPSKKAAPAPVPAQPGSLKLAFLGWYGVVGTALGYVLPFKPPFAEGYAKEYWRHALGSLLLVLALLGGIVGLTLYLLDANDFKAQIVDYVKTHKQRDLVLDGDIHVTWFPQLGLETGKLSLSQRNSSRKFASVENARLYVAWWPLLRKQVQVERVVLDGVHANLLRHPDGSSNFDDLLVPADWMGELQFAVEKVRVLESSFNLQDEASGQAFFVHGLNLETGRLADATAGQVQASLRLQSVQPQLDLQLRLNAQLLYDHASHRYELSQMEGQAQGDAVGFNELLLDWRGRLTAWPGQHKLLLEPFSATARGRLAQDHLEGKLAAARVQLTRELWQASTLALEGRVTREQSVLAATLQAPAIEAGTKAWKSADVQATLELKHAGGTLQGRGNSPLLYDSEKRLLQLEALNTSWSASHPLLAARLQATANGKLSAALATQEVTLDVKAGIDDNQLSGRVQLQDFKAPAWTFDLAASALDLDRYLVSDWTRRLQDSTQAKDFDALNTLNLRGKLRSDSLRVARLQTGAFAAELRAASGTLSVEPITAHLYGGSLSGGLSLSAGETPKLAMRQKLSGVQIDALLADLTGSEARLSGKGQLLFDLNAQGATLPALRQSLTGTASLALTRGTLAGVQLGEALLAGKEQLGLTGAERRDSVRLTENTAYNELKASLSVEQGKARSEDLLLKSPLFTSKGEVDLALDTLQIDAWLDTTVTPGLKRASAGELAELSGINIPMRINGQGSAATLSYSLGEASGGNLPRLARANQARVTAAMAPAPAAPASMTTTASTAGAGKPAGK